MFRYDFDVMESLKKLEELGGTKHSHCGSCKSDVSSCPSASSLAPCWVNFNLYQVIQQAATTSPQPTPLNSPADKSAIAGAAAPSFSAPRACGGFVVHPPRSLAAADDQPPAARARPPPNGARENCKNKTLVVALRIFAISNIFIVKIELQTSTT